MPTNSLDNLTDDQLEELRAKYNVTVPRGFGDYRTKLIQALASRGLNANDYNRLHSQVSPTIEADTEAYRKRHFRGMKALPGGGETTPGRADLTLIEGEGKPFGDVDPADDEAVLQTRVKTLWQMTEGDHPDEDWGEKRFFLIQGIDTPNGHVDKVVYVNDYSANVLQDYGYPIRVLSDEEGIAFQKSILSGSLGALQRSQTTVDDVYGGRPAREQDEQKLRQIEARQKELSRNPYTDEQGVKRGMRGIRGGRLGPVSDKQGDLTLIQGGRETSLAQPDKQSTHFQPTATNQEEIDYLYRVMYSDEYYPPQEGEVDYWVIQLKTSHQPQFILIAGPLRAAVELEERGGYQGKIRAANDHDMMIFPNEGL